MINCKSWHLTKFMTNLQWQWFIPKVYITWNAGALVRILNYKAQILLIKWPKSIDLATSYSYNSGGGSVRTDNLLIGLSAD